MRDGFGVLCVHILVAAGVILTILAVSVSVGAETSVNGTLDDHGSHYYTIDVTSTGEPIAVTVTFEGSWREDIDLFLVDPKGIQVSSGETSDKGEESLRSDPWMKGVHRLEVKTYRIDSSVGKLNYTLNCSHALTLKGSEFTIEAAYDETFWFYLDVDSNEKEVEITLRWKIWRAAFDLSIYKGGEPIAEAQFSDDSSSRYGWYVNQTTFRLNETGRYTVRLYCNDTPWYSWGDRWSDDVHIISSSTLTLSQFEFKDQLPNIGLLWYDIELDAPEKVLDLNITMFVWGYDVKIDLYNPHGALVKELSHTYPPSSRITLSGIMGTYGLRVYSERTFSEHPVNVSGQCSCPVERVNADMTEIRAKNSTTTLEVDVDTYNRPMEIVLFWETEHDVHAELYNPSGIRSFIIKKDGPSYKSCFLNNIGNGAYTIRIWVEGTPYEGDVVVEVVCSYPLAMKGPEEEGGLEWPDIVGPIKEHRTVLLVVLVLLVLVLAIRAGVRAHRNRPGPTPVEVMWMDGVEDDSEGTEEAPVKGSSDNDGPVRAYCAFCGYRYKSPERTDCPECGRDREEG